MRCRKRVQDGRTAGRGPNPKFCWRVPRARSRPPISHRQYLTGETLAIELSLGEDGAGVGTDGATADGYREQTEVDGLELTIALRRARHAP